MKYLKRILISAKEIIITYIIEYLIIILSCLFYTLLINKDLTSFINNILPFITIISLLLITIYLYKNNIREENNIKYNYIPIIISIGISLSCLLNMFIFKIYPPKEPTTNISILIIISTCLVGPIYEEILFRYIFLNRLKKYNTPLKAVLINSFIFALIHLNFKEIIFAFFLSLIINIIYQKYNNIIYPIILHSSANIISLFLLEYNNTIIILSLICLLINYEIIRNQ